MFTLTQVTAKPPHLPGGVRLFSQAEVQHVRKQSQAEVESQAWRLLWLNLGSQTPTKQLNI